MRKFAIFVMLLLLAYGCVSNMGGSQYAQSYYDDIRQHGRIAVSDPSQLEECQVGSCHCFVCESGLNIESLGMSNNLAGGSCQWNTNCTRQTTSDLLWGDDNEGIMIRQFMIGQGPSISDFSDAQTYCHYGLSMAVQWLLADEENPYGLPDASRAICLLTKDVMPVYVMYSGGEDIDATRAGDIAHVLYTEGDDVTLGTLTEGPVGPVVVVTEMNADASQADLVAEQVRRINDECNPNRHAESGEINCFVAVAPKFNDYEAMDALLNTPGIKEEVDLVAYGIDYRYAHGCDPDDIIMSQALNFSEHALYNHGKPTIIPYILFDSSGPDADNTCQWSENLMTEAYSAFWPDTILALQQKGVIGAAPYSMYSTQYGVMNPLECNDCDLAKNQNRLRSWFAGCQDYAQISSGSTNTRGAGTPIIFPNESAGYCDQGGNLDFMIRQVQYANLGGGGDLLNPVQSELDDPDPVLYRCMDCITNNLTREEPPFNFGVASVSMTGTPPEEWCTSFPEIEAWADRRNIDPLLVRAFIRTESGFDPCAAAKVCAADYEGAGCFARVTSGASECYAKPAYDEMYDPAGNCTFAIAPDSDTDSPQWRWCALGLMQVTDPPYTFWPDDKLPEGLTPGVDNPYYDIFDRSGFDTPSMRDQRIPAARACAPDGRFNPFNVSHTLCFGTAKMAENLGDARTWIENNRAYLNWGEEDYEKDSVFAAYIAANMYAGFWYAGSSNPECPSSWNNGRCWADNFRDSWEIDAEWCEDNRDKDEYPPECTDDGLPDLDQCYGYTDFVEYVHDCEIQYLPRQADPGANKMAAYYQLKNGCEIAWCPPDKRLIQLAYEDDWEDYLPSSGSPYILDEEDETGEE
ncbi:hypothetical protein GF318_00975 [Candidatus Micrarchaeota archaeon]|nr:hypothetical protein [Candidatus Micrarchaeota archaeon]